MNNFQICNADTDSISFGHPDGKYISIPERESLIKEINDLSPEFMLWADDGYYKKVIILKAKNYILLKENDIIIYKGASLKSSKLEPALKQFINEIIDVLLDIK